jgi:hypothetical protein
MSIAHVHMPGHFAAASARLPARNHLPTAHSSGRVEDQNALAAVDSETPEDLLWLGRLLCLASSAVTLALIAVVFA